MTVPAAGKHTGYVFPSPNACLQEECGISGGLRKEVQSSRTALVVSCTVLGSTSVTNKQLLRVMRQQSEWHTHHLYHAAVHDACTLLA